MTLLSRMRFVLLLTLLTFGCKGEHEKTLPQGATEEAVQAAQECDDGDLAACKRLAEMFQVGSNGLAADKDRAKTIQDYACEEGLAEACKGPEERFINSLSSETGEVYEQALGYAKACDGGGMTACVSLAELFERGRAGMPRNEGKAAHLLLRACSGKNEDACRHVQRYLDSKEIDSQDRSELVGIADAACSSGDDDWCWRLGQCIVEGECSATKTLHCKQTSWCSEEGLCSFSEGRCIAVEDSDCAESLVCSRSGFCSAKSGSCAIGKDSDCRRSPGCVEEGLCSYREDKCVATSDDECRSSAVCSSHSRCWAKDGLCFDRDAECKKAPACAKDGLCVAADSGCVATALDCKRSTNCRKKGRCTLQDGQCLVTTVAECRSSTECSTHNRCSLGKDGHCFNLIPTEEKNGQVFRTGTLVWKKDPIRIGQGVCSHARSACNNLSLGSWRWRLPSSDELRKIPASRMVRGQFATNAGSGDGCHTWGGISAKGTLAWCVADNVGIDYDQQLSLSKARIRSANTILFLVWLVAMRDRPPLSSETKKWSVFLEQRGMNTGANYENVSITKLTIQEDQFFEMRGYASSHKYTDEVLKTLRPCPHISKLKLVRSSRIRSENIVEFVFQGKIADGLGLEDWLKLYFRAGGSTAKHLSSLLEDTELGYDLETAATVEQRGQETLSLELATRLFQGVPVESRLAEFIHYIEEIAEGDKVDLLTYEPGKSSDSEGLEAMPISLDLRGDVLATLGVLIRIHRGTRLAVVHKLELAVSKTEISTTDDPLDRSLALPGQRVISRVHVTTFRNSTTF